MRHITALMIMLVVGETNGRPFSRSHQGIKNAVPNISMTSKKRQSRQDVARFPMTIPRGGGDDLSTPIDILVDVAADTLTSSPMGPVTMIVETLNGLKKYMNGPKADTVLLLLTTALNNPLCQKLKVSPILGFLLLGLLFGPNGRNLIKDVHTTEMMADLGIVLFLFEMGIHLDFKTLMAMKKDVFGIGLSQFTITGIVVAAICASLKYSGAATVIIGWSLALSSSAFVLQLLKDKDQMDTQYGRSSFGTLLLQDLMVVPLLVLTPILAGGGGTIGEAIGKALIQITIALSAIGVFGKFIMNPMFDLVAASGSQEAFIGAILATVLGMSFLTEGLGLSNTLGAFLSGMLLADTKHRHHIETEAGPFRGILVGLFFFTVGFEVDLGMIMSTPIKIALTVFGILTIKAAIAAAVCKGFGLPWSIAQRVGLVLSQGGEFAFVAFRTARSSGILSDEQTKFLLTCVSLTMALTPSLEDVGTQIAAKLELMEAQAADSPEHEEVVIESMTVSTNEQEAIESDSNEQEPIEDEDNSE
jgi:CPA2 family monovalent cation:H+ antiporter-2